jgi:selenocysteine lyase/cysteine desulfurase
MPDALFAEEFPQVGGLIYLNHAAVAPWPLRTAEAVRAFAAENTRSGAQHYPRWLAREARLREQLRELVNAASVDDIALTKNTSEAISLVAEGIDWQAGDNIVTTTEEFPSNRIPWQAQAQRGVNLREVRINQPGPEQALIDACDRATRLLTVSSVQYGSGARLDLELLGAHCRKRGILFCVDAIQSLGAIACDVQASGADFVMADGHKWLLGPEGLALFYSRPEARDRLRLHQFGWHMVEAAGNFDQRDWRIAHSAQRFECGSPNMLGIHALSASLSLLLEIGMAEVSRRVLERSTYLYELLMGVSGIRFLTPVEERRRAGIINFTIAGCDPARLHRGLLDRNVICAHRGGGVRLSPHFYTSLQELDRAVACVSELIDAGKSR